MAIIRRRRAGKLAGVDARAAHRHPLGRREGPEVAHVREKIVPTPLVRPGRLAELTETVQHLLHICGRRLRLCACTSVVLF